MAMDPSGKLTTKAQFVYDELSRSIRLGELKPGERIDQERTAAALKVSRMPLRQALQRLEAERLVDMEPYRSAVVAPFDVGEIEDIYAMRIVLEKMLAEVGINRCGPDVPLQMAALNGLMLEAVRAGNLSRYVELDRQFHRVLYEASGHRRACSTVEQLRDASDRYIHFYASKGSGGERSVQEHAEIVQSVKDGAAQVGSQLTEHHVREGRDTLLSLVIGEQHAVRQDDSPAHRPPSRHRPTTQE